MPMGLADAFDQAEHLTLASPDAAVLLRLRALSFHLLRHGLPIRTQSGQIVSTPRPIIAEFEYFPFGAPIERSFNAARAWLPEDTDAIGNLRLDILLRGQFRILRRGGRPLRQRRIPRHAEYSFEALHPGFEALRVPLDPDTTWQRASASAPPPDPVTMVVEFAICSLRAEAAPQPLPPEPMPHLSTGG